MNISNTGGVSAAAFAQTYGVAVAQKSQDQIKTAGADSLSLIQSAAAPKLQEGQTINVMA